MIPRDLQKKLLKKCLPDADATDPIMREAIGAIAYKEGVPMDAPTCHFCRNPGNLVRGTVHISGRLSTILGHAGCFR